MRANRSPRTLHDGLQQLLVIAALNLEQQQKRDSDGGAAPSELIRKAKHQLDEAIAAARSLNFELFPPVLQRSGLPAALKWLADWTHDKYRIEVRVAADPRADSGRKDVRTLLFESVRELLFNAVKHAPYGSSLAGADARPRRPAVHHGFRSGNRVRTGGTRRSIEGRPGWLGAVQHP